MRIDRAKMANKALLGTNLRSAPVCPRVRRYESARISNEYISPVSLYINIVSLNI